MKLGFILACLLLLSSCGYHLVGQGESVVIPQGVTSASLSVVGDDKPWLEELSEQWQQHADLPSLQDESVRGRVSEKAGEQHITMRVEQALETFSPIAFAASGLAIQYRFQLQAMLQMYQKEKLIWSSDAVVVSADVFGKDNPSVIEAERVRLGSVLRQQWVKEALNRLNSGF
ncbi:MAG: hypothetical protein R8M45_11255 [Ghiorsea sp.]